MLQSSAADRLPFWGGLALCILTGAAHMADTAFFVDAASGFAAYGPALARCAAAAAAAALLWWLGRGAAACPQRQPGGGAALLSALLRIAGAALAALAVEHFVVAWQRVTGLLPYFSGPREAWQVFASLAQPGVPGLLAGGVLALLAAWWLLVPGPKALSGGDELPGAGVGALLLLWPFWLALQRFLVDPASVERLPATLRVLSAAALLVFGVALLRAVYVPAQPNGRSLFRAGMLCFLFGTCLELPQAVFELVHSAGGAEDAVTAVVMGLFGLCGLTAAWLATGPETLPAAEKTPPSKPRSGAKRA